MSKRKTGNTVKIALIILVVMLIFAVMFHEQSPVTTQVETFNKPTVNEEKVNVHFIDVGQGSSVLIQQGKEGILIDSGEDSYSEELCDYILSAGVETFPYIIATHPHSDHIGGLDEVIEQNTVSQVLMPYLTKSNEPDTKVYSDLCESITFSGAEVVNPDFGYTVSLSDDVRVEFIGPVKQDDELNNMSLICKVTAFSTTFMFMGDAEKEEIDSVYDRGADIDCDVLFVPHHGSETSIHDDFFYEVSADIAVVSCGEDNSYGHPHDEVIEFHENLGSEIYRTDFEDNIIISCSSDGYDIQL